MKRLRISTKVMVVGLTVALTLGAVGVLLTTRPPSTDSATRSANKQSTQTQIPSSTDASSETSTTGSDKKSNSNAAAQDAGSTKTTTPTNAACKQLTIAVAQQVIGADAKTSSPSDTSALKTANTKLDACAYNSGGGNVQLVIRTPSNALGISKNATVFGSEKPADAVSVSGYGQSAYWDPSKQQLNILSSNNWYIVTRSTGAQADAEAVAKLLAGL
jgi:cytoskeletal protein RodZ